jgi:hypothetical protein
MTNGDARVKSKFRREPEHFGSGKNLEKASKAEENKFRNNAHFLGFF